MSFYLILNLSIIIIPFLFSFEKNIKFYKKLPFLFLSILSVSSFYIIWDSIATTYGNWSFNKEFVGNFSFFNLPVEEILFFITVPYSCIFIYETVMFYLKEKEISFIKEIYLLITLLLIANSLYFRSQNYTAVVLLICGIFFMITALFYSKILKSIFYWVTIAITFIPFLIVNYLLTSLPVVKYNNEQTWGVRILTIPIEDFFYSFSMISFWLLAYDFFKSKFSETKIKY